MSIEFPVQKSTEKLDFPVNTDGLKEVKELPKDIESGEKRVISAPDVSFIERTSRASLMEECLIKVTEMRDFVEATIPEVFEIKSEGLTEGEKEKIREEQGWSTRIIDGIQNMDQYEILKNANLVEAKINGKECLIKKDLDLDFPDPDNKEITNRDRIARGMAPLDRKTGKPIELHHLGQSADSPLVELTEEEHRTGEYKDGKKNQALWHDNAKETEVHGEGNSWNQERKAHWKARAENSEG